MEDAGGTKVGGVDGLGVRNPDGLNVGDVDGSIDDGPNVGAIDGMIV